MEQRNFYKFILVIIMPLLLLTLVCINFGYIITGIIFVLLMLDGIFGLLRANRHIILKQRFTTCDLRIIKNPFCSMFLFGIYFFKPIPIHRNYVSLCEREEILLRKVQGFETGYFLKGVICLLEFLYWTIKSIIKRKFQYNNCFKQEIDSSAMFNDYCNRRYQYAWVDFLFNNTDTSISLQN